MSKQLNDRKAEHIQIVLDEHVTGHSITTGLENYHFIHNALPELSFDDIDIEQNFFSKPCKSPFLISSMTGGANFAESINRNLALAAEQKGWALALGSTRALIESEAYRPSFDLRKYAPTIPIIANLGAVQLNYGFTERECRKIIEYTGADALVLHLNILQEVIQPEGNIDFNGLLSKIEKLCNDISIPVGVKEVGWGIDRSTAEKLINAGISFIDVAGAGGTSWSQVEKYRTDPIKQQAAAAFSEWGIPTTISIESVKPVMNEKTLIASGGLHTGVDAAKCIALGADFAGFGRAILEQATISAESVLQTMEVRELELRMAMFAVGAKNVGELQQTDRLQKINP
ncbi:MULTISPECIES: type 2 isopentenyl-diphosphate Delta-isomerase [unclassified Sporosarcina]|uniref:type 2 isopentenyl-diphosphate Delta-isomerase n=1 Tax=unclassified Sporosarcina TaxID=2647733 RepID=UPI0020401862|nr:MULTISPECIES: type 2 isopentenyl-diphosphate Delta-isomerase [unclassified Sporosarcina]GKV65812.1 isopentenyl-diphosphate delta-isomerase [Sporosarcina sp. NCCP-2331]GLB55936.1 isopentenyl-diphosphate delta-isomerase [Sporosarcina sp. NCCP-2378]